MREGDKEKLVALFSRLGFQSFLAHSQEGKAPKTNSKRRKKVIEDTRKTQEEFDF